MNFQVPQFIEVEDKIFGPLTFRQFVYLAGGAGTSFLLWSFIPFHLIALLFILPVAALALALAFYRVNNRPFIATVEAAARYLVSSKLFIWRQRQNGGASTAANQTPARGPRALVIPKLSDSKLKDLSWSLDVKETLQ